MQVSTMKLTKLFIVFIVALFSLNNIAAQNVIPKANPPVLVTDLAGVLSPEEKQALENKLVAVDDASSNQIAVVILPTLDGNPLKNTRSSFLENGELEIKNQEMGFYY